MPTTDRRMQKFMTFLKGMNNVAAEHDLEKDELRDALNTDLDNQGLPRRRPGRTKVYTGQGKVHSLWSGKGRTFVVDNGNLLSLNDSYSPTTVVSGLSVDMPVSFTETAGTVYYSNGLSSGKILPSDIAVPWGMECPAGQPVLTPGAGGLPAGVYQVAVTFVTSSGEESGTGIANSVVLSSTGGVELSRIPQPSRSDIDRIYVYMTDTNGEGLYRRAVINVGMTEFSVNSLVERGRMLETQFLREIPAGHIVRYFRGRIYVAAQNTVFYTEHWRYGLYHPTKNWFQFPSRVTTMEPTPEGIFVHADKVYYLPGRTPEQMEIKPVDANAAVAGTSVQVLATMFNSEAESDDRYPCWFSKLGWVVGFPDGTIQAASKNRVAVPDYEAGAGMFRELDGVRQLIAAVRGGGTADKFAAKDEITGTIIRNGITVN